EHDLKKAIKASLQEAKRHSIIGIEEGLLPPPAPVLSMDSAVKKRKGSAASTASSSSTTTSSNQNSSSCSSSSINIGHRKGKIPPQRKFAQNSLHPQQVNSHWKGLPSCH